MPHEFHFTNLKGDSFITLPETNPEAHIFWGSRMNPWSGLNPGVRDEPSLLREPRGLRPGSFASGTLGGRPWVPFYRNP